MQMGYFLRDYWRGKTIVLNDIGAANFYGDIGCIDYIGLANVEVVRRIKEGDYTADWLSALAHKKNAQIAIAYERWLRMRLGKVPSDWRKIGEWTITNNKVCAGETVSFYAIAPGTDARLRENLTAFAGRLPAGVTNRVLQAR
jgi:hypothetical protein